MNILTVSSFFALVFLYLLAQISGHVFNMYSSRYYRIFHFAGGFLVYTFFSSFVDIKIMNLLLVTTVGILWEIYELVFWKYISKRKVDKPVERDTKDDLYMDFVGGVSALILTSLIQIILKFLSSRGMF